MSHAVTDALRAQTAAPAQLSGDAPWQDFDPEAYFQHYYGEPHPDDDTLTFLAARALREAKTLPGRDLDIVDVGTGPSLIPLLTALPVATGLTAWEYAPPNLQWLHNEITSPQLRPQWLHFWSQVKAAHSNGTAGMSPLLPHDPLLLLTQRVRIVRGSIFDLPRHAYDAATMFFCAESITSCPAEFDSALAAFLATVRPGGIIAAAFLAGSSGYAVSGRRYPAVKLDAAQIEAALKTRLTSLTVTPIGISPEEVRSGYTGAIFISGRTPS